jgi:N-acyl amino acid synthase of PEP-CTERM/exosortase system
LQNSSSNLPNDPLASTSPAGPQSPAEKFTFPGLLRLQIKLLIKEDNVLDYESLYSLRYQVYCHEAHFLDPDDYSDGLEHDEFDAFSEHFLARNPNNNDEVVGAVRLVRWSEYLAFPTIKHFNSLLKQLNRLKFPLESSAEISRLCITKQYRRRTVDGLFGAGSYVDKSDNRRKFPMVLLELFKNMYLASKYALGITHWIATFEESLYRLLERYGVHFNLLIPEEIDYYGKVKIYGASLQHLEEEMKRRRPDLYGFFCEQLEYT